MYTKPKLIVIDLTEELPIFTACKVWENDSQSCY